MVINLQPFVTERANVHVGSSYLTPTTASDLPNLGIPTINVSTPEADLGVVRFVRTNPPFSDTLNYIILL